MPGNGSRRRSGCSGHLNSQIHQAEQHLAVVLPNTPAGVLTTPGVSVVRASNYGAALGDPARFAKAHRDAAPPGQASKWLALVPDGANPVQAERHTVTYVVLAKSARSGADWLPFFSKLNLMQHGRQLHNMRFPVSISRLDG